MVLVLVTVAIDRLVEMLAWHHEDEKEIRLNAAAIVKSLVSSTQNGSRIIAVSGSLENIMSLIKTDEVVGPLHAEGTLSPLHSLAYHLTITIDFSFI